MQHTPSEHEQGLLDPHDWEAFRQVAHRMVDDMVSWLRDIRQQPVWTAPPDTTRQELARTLPETPAELEDIYQRFVTHILPYNKGNIHPRFWSWVQGTGLPTGMLADMLASAMNPNMGIGNHAPVYVERQVLDWCKQMLGYAPEASGVLVTGATAANLTALEVALTARCGFDVRAEGVAAAPRPIRYYASAEAHSCIRKSLELMGLGSKALRLVPVDDDYRMRPADLERMIQGDLAAGLQPLCVVATVGSVNTGAIDPVDTIAEIARRHNLWLHVDGAFGALAALLPEYAPLQQAMAKADSLAFDLHKWLYLNYEIGCVLVRDAAAHRQAFAYQPSYLLNFERGLAAGPEPFSNLSVQLSRSFKALKAWFAFQEFGIDRFRLAIRENILQCQYLTQLIAAQPQLELLAPTELNIVCYRYRPAGLNDPALLDQLNREILMTLHERGLAAPSSTVLQGRFAIRVANTNHRSSRSDFDALVADTLALGHELLPRFSATHTHA